MTLQSRTSVAEVTPRLKLDSLLWLNKRESLNVAVWGDPHPPLLMGYDPSVYEGVSADYVAILGQALNKEIKVLHYANYASALEALYDGDVDILAIYDASIVPEDDLLLSAPYFFDHEVLAYKEDLFKKKTSPLNGKSLAYIGDDYTRNMLEEIYPTAKLQKHRYYSSAMAALAYGSADAFWLNSSTADYLASQGIESHAKIMPSQLSKHSDLTFAVTTENVLLLEAINATLVELPQISRLRIANNWGLDPSYVTKGSTIDFTQEEKDWLQQHSEITAWLPDHEAPLSFIDAQGNLCGYARSLLKILSGRTGIHFTLRRLQESSASTPSLPADSNDMIVTAIKGGENDELLYSNNYAFSPWVIVVDKQSRIASSLNAFNGKRVAISAGSGVLPQLKMRYPLVLFTEVDDVDTALKLLSENKVSAVISPQISADYLITVHYPNSLFVANSLELLPARFAVGVGAHNTMLQQIINKTLAELSPQTIQRDLSQWQNYQAPLPFNIWDNYRRYFIQFGAAICIISLLVFLRTQHLKRIILQRKGYETKLQNQLSFIRTLIDGSPVALYVRDRNLELVQCNKTYLDFLQVSADEVMGKKLDESLAMAKEGADFIQNMHDKTMVSGEPNFITTHVVVKGKTYHIYWWALPYRDHAENVLGVIGGFIDITERDKLMAELERARQHAEEANASKSLFLAQMSHEIRTPMNALIGLLELEHRGKSKPEMREKNIAVAYDAAKSLLSLVGDILDLAKIESGARQITLMPVALTSVLQTNQKLFANGAAGKGIKLSTKLNVTHPVILFDSLMLNQIASNLLSNAIKFTSEGCIELAITEISSQREGGEYQLTVKDTGVGLDERQQQAIFEPFVQIEGHSSRPQGTGLGLSICRQLAERLGGKLWVESIPGEGSCFIFSFSAGSCEDLNEPEVKQKYVSTIVRNILIVDDHKPNRILLSQQLEYAGHRVTAVEDAEQALLSWDSAFPPYDMVLTDCNMPGMDGFKLVETLRERELRAGRDAIPIFGLTAMAEPEVVTRGRASGMTDCLFKPIDLNKLLSRITVLPENKNDQDRQLIISLQELSSSSPVAYCDLVDTMIDTNRQDLIQLKKASALHDGTVVGQIVHRLLGSANLVGAQTMTAICRELSELTDNLDSPKFHHALERCENEVNRLEKELTKSKERLLIPQKMQE
jgi:two-component system sensor histidine kinase EvgS